MGSWVIPVGIEERTQGSSVVLPIIIAGPPIITLVPCPDHKIGGHNAKMDSFINPVVADNQKLASFYTVFSPDHLEHEFLNV